MSDKNLDAEAERMTELLEGRVVKFCARYNSGELIVFFADGTRLFVNASSDLDFSITGAD